MTPERSLQMTILIGTGLVAGALLSAPQEVWRLETLVVAAAVAGPAGSCRRLELSPLGNAAAAAAVGAGLVAFGLPSTLVGTALAVALCIALVENTLETALQAGAIWGTAAAVASLVPSWPALMVYTVVCLVAGPLLHPAPHAGHSRYADLLAVGYMSLLWLLFYGAVALGSVPATAYLLVMLGGSLTLLWLHRRWHARSLNRLKGPPAAGRRQLIEAGVLTVLERLAGAADLRWQQRRQLLEAALVRDLARPADEPVDGWLDHVLAQDDSAVGAIPGHARQAAARLEKTLVLAELAPLVLYHHCGRTSTEADGENPRHVPYLATLLTASELYAAALVRGDQVVAPGAEGAGAGFHHSRAADWLAEGAGGRLEPAVGSLLLEMVPPVFLPYRRSYEAPPTGLRWLADTGEGAPDVWQLVRFAEDVLQHMKDGVMLVDERDHVRLVNPAFYRILDRGGLDPSDAPQRALDLLRAHAPYCPVDQVRRTGEPVNDDVFVLAAPRGERTLIVQALPAGQGPDEGCRVLLFISDRSRRRRLEAVIRRQERLSALGEMAAAAAHEIRNPLASIKGYMQLMQRGADAQARERYYGIIAREIGRLEAIVTDMLDAGAVRDLSVDEVDVAKLLEECVTIAATTSSGVELVVSATGDLPPLLGDRNRLKQVLDNLIKNAVEATGPGGFVRVGAEASGDYLLITVTDNGPGMPADHLLRVFDPFYTTKQNGTGLGLAVCYSIVRQHGGIIEVETPQGKGCCFTVGLPLDGPPHHHASPWRLHTQTPKDRFAAL